MARMKKQEAAPAPTSLVASAARIRGGYSMGTFRTSPTAEAWHEEVWNYYDTIGEFRYACDWIGAQLSKALIYATVETADGVQKITDGSIMEYLSALFGNADGRAEMFRLIGIHMSVTGDCYILGYPDTDEFSDGGDKWEVAASTMVTRPATDSPTEKWKVNDVTLDVDPADVLCIRIWRPHPRKPHLSISPAKAIRSTLNELYKLSQHVSAQVDSRLAGAGVLLMPSTMGLPTPEQTDGQEAIVQKANNADELMKLLMEAMARSIADRDDASALVPIVITASAADIAAVKHLTFWSELDAHAIELRKEAIGRLALGMDMPPEILQGAAEANHWSAWQADESAIKSHTEPLLKIITTALGKEYLRPLLKDDPAYNAERLAAFSVAADTSEMRLRPNRSKEALELHDRGILTDEALVRETGFDDTDMVDDEGRKNWLLRKMAQGSTTPEFVQAAAKELGVTLDIPAPAPGETQEGRPAPSLTDHPANDIPDQKISADRKQARAEGRVPSSDVERKASLLAACDQIVLRALERAGNRLKNKTQTKFTVAASELHCYVISDEAGIEDMLADAWSYVPMVAARAGMDGGQLSVELYEYTADLLRTQTAHSYEHLEAFMTRELVAA